MKNGEKIEDIPLCLLNKWSEENNISLEANDIKGVGSDDYDMYADKKSEDEDIQVYGYKITVEDEKFGELTGVFSFRNYSNGYYGGWMNTCENRKVLPEITDTVLESAEHKE